MGRGFDTIFLGEGPVQNSPECQNANNCPSCGSSSTWTACCAKDAKSGKSYCSCGSFSSSNNECPQLITVNKVKAANGKRDGPLGILDPSLQADSYIITTYYTGAGFNEPDQPVTLNVQDDSLHVTITGASSAGDNEYVMFQDFRADNGVVKIARDYLKKLKSEEIVRLLDKEIVQQIAKIYSSEILEEQVMEMN